MTRKLFIVETNPTVLWEAFDSIFGIGYFNKVIEEKLLANITISSIRSSAGKSPIVVQNKEVGI
jgi:hypothetical protein